MKSPVIATEKKLRGLVCSAFDLLHAGHMLMLEDAKNHCDILVAGLQVDPSVTDVAYRGQKKDKPVLSVKERGILLKGIRYIDEVFVYTDEPDLYIKIKNFGPHIRILGSDWRERKATGQEFADIIYYHERTHDYSTSSLRKRITSFQEIVVPMKDTPSR